MIQLTKINNEIIIINSRNIECVEVIPESKVIMETGKYYIVKESAEEIIDKSIKYEAQIISRGRISVID